GRGPMRMAVCGVCAAASPSGRRAKRVSAWGWGPTRINKRGLMRLCALILAALSVGSAVRAQSTEERSLAREIVKKKSDAVVMIMATLKIRANVGGTEQTIDQQAQAN